MATSSATLVERKQARKGERERELVRGMGEVVVSNGRVAAEGEGEAPSYADGGGEGRAGGSPGGVVKWERFLPRMVLQVLLVEADDSTRQIIAALLRKCSYRGQSAKLSNRSSPVSPWFSFLLVISFMHLGSFFFVYLLPV